MWLLPYEHFTIVTTLSPEGVQSTFEAYVSPGYGDFFRRACATYFDGYAVNGKFEFKRDIVGRNSFLPKISGFTEPHLKGSRIHVKMRMFTFVIIFMCFWLGFAAIGGIVMLVTQSAVGHYDLKNFLGFLMFLFGYVLMMGAFKSESIKAKNTLLEIFDGEIERQ